MIFICLGTQIYQFDRLLKEIDNLIEVGIIKDEVFAQIGYKKYEPKHFNYSEFLSHEEFDRKRSQADLIISHGGTGALIGSLKIGKNVIAVPRLSCFSEHVDDHQIQIVKVLEESGYIRAVYDICDLGKTIKEALEKPIIKVYEQKSRIIELITKFIENNQ